MGHRVAAEYLQTRVSRARLHLDILFVERVVAVSSLLGALAKDTLTQLIVVSLALAYYGQENEMYK